MFGDLKFLLELHVWIKKSFSEIVMKNYFFYFMVPLHCFFLTPKKTINIDFDSLSISINSTFNFFTVNWSFFWMTAVLNASTVFWETWHHNEFKSVASLSAFIWAFFWSRAFNLFLFFYRRVILEKMGVNKMSLSEFFVLLKFSASSPWIFR